MYVYLGEWNIKLYVQECEGHFFGLLCGFISFPNSSHSSASKIENIICILHSSDECCELIFIQNYLSLKWSLKAKE